MSPGNRRWMLLALLSVLLLGTSLGVLGERLLMGDENVPQKQRSGEIWFDCAREPQPSPAAEKEERRQRHLEDFSGELGLDEAQTAVAAEILGEHSVRARSFWHQTRSQYCDMLRDVRSELRQGMTEEQQILFDARTARIEEKMRREHQ